MSELRAGKSNGPRLRADAERSIAAILDAAAKMLGERPDAKVEEIAREAGVTRQTVYAHFSSREKLIVAVIERATQEGLDAVDAARLDEGPAPEALMRLLATARQMFEQFPLLLHKTFVELMPAWAREHHEPILEPLERLIKRGQESGDFDRKLPVDWMLAAMFGLGDIASQEVSSGRMTPREATRALQYSVLRLFGVDEPPID
ncbi:MAG: TetR/AcrR family transcriptional regulator [Nitrolancea sp.]